MSPKAWRWAIAASILLYGTLAVVAVSIYSGYW